MNFTLGLKLALLSLISIFFFVTPSYAQNSNPKGPKTDTINIGDNLPKTNMGVPAAAGSNIIGTVLKNTISLFFIVGGLATLIYFVWGATDWIMSGGDKEKVAGARKKMTNAVIGLVLLSLSYFLVGLVGDIVGFNPLGPFDIKGLGEQ
jgi:hypothetical protein